MTGNVFDMLKTLRDAETLIEGQLSGDPEPSAYETLRKLRMYSTEAHVAAFSEVAIAVGLSALYGRALYGFFRSGGKL